MWDCLLILCLVWNRLKVKSFCKVKRKSVLCGLLRNYVISFWKDSKISYWYILYFQSPYTYVVLVISSSVIFKLPRFFEFELNEDRTDFRTTSMMEDPHYIRFNAYWTELIATGFLPLIVLIYFNFRIYLEVIEVF